jgi:hypothetical protein
MEARQKEKGDAQLTQPSSGATVVPSQKLVTRWTNVLFKVPDEKTEVERRHNLELHGKGRGLLGFGKLGSPKEEVQISLRSATESLKEVVGTSSVAFAPCRASFCYALNQQRSVNTELKPLAFDAVGEVMEAFLTGCCWKESEEDVANAKMLMMLGQTFYCPGREDRQRGMSAPSTPPSASQASPAKPASERVGQSAKIYSSSDDAWYLATCVGYDDGSKIHTFKKSGSNGGVNGTFNGTFTDTVNDTVALHINDSTAIWEVPASTTPATPSTVNKATNKADRPDRSSRIYIKNKISSHGIWSIDDFWDKALNQCICEGLVHSKVMVTLHQQAMVKKKSEGRQLPNSDGLKWHDLLVEQRDQATGQVLDIVTSQLTALAHSMVEYDDRSHKHEKLDRTQKFVRRMSVQYQLGIERRQQLLEHLMEVKATKKRSSKAS